VCSSDLQAPGIPPFIDDFENGRLDFALWGFGDRVLVLDGVSSAPSGSHAARLLGREELRSRIFDASAWPGVQIEFSARTLEPDHAGSLRLEIQNASGNWFT